MTYFKENEHISMKSKKYQILANFPKRAFYRSVLLHKNFQYFGPNHDIFISNKGLYPVDSVGKIHKIAYLLIFWQINTKHEIYWESCALNTVEIQ